MSRWILALVLPIALAQGGPGVDGNWLGTLNAGPRNLRLALKVAKAADGSFSAKLNSIDQGATDLPVSSIHQNGLAVRFELKQIGGAFEGTLNASGSELSGRWSQNGATLPLVFRRSNGELPTLSRPQEPKKPYPYIEEEITYENRQGGAKLAGTLTLPQGGGPFPAVLLITGSGQQDRDESLMGHKPFLVLADYLTRKGIAVLRVDDRGVGGSTGEVKTATTEDFAGDVLAGVEFLKIRKQIDAHKIGLIGHSEGGTIAPMVAVHSRDVSFIVMMAGTGVPGDQVMQAQAAAIGKGSGIAPDAIAKNAELQRQMMDIIKQESDSQAREAKLLELKAKISMGNPAASGRLNAQFQMAASPWFRFIAMYDPATALRKVTCPVLALNGELDLQVLADQNLPAIEQALKAGNNKDYKIVKLPRLNHLLQTAQTGSPAEYAQIEETMAPVALQTISDWILRHTGGAPKFVPRIANQ